MKRIIIWIVFIGMALMSIVFIFNMNVICSQKPITGVYVRNVEGEKIKYSYDISYIGVMNNVDEADAKYSEIDVAVDGIANSSIEYSKVKEKDIEEKYSDNIDTSIIDKYKLNNEYSEVIGSFDDGNSVRVVVAKDKGDTFNLGLFEINETTDEIKEQGKWQDAADGVMLSNLFATKEDDKNYKEKNLKKSIGLSYEWDITDLYIDEDNTIWIMANRYSVLYSVTDVNRYEDGLGIVGIKDGKVISNNEIIIDELRNNDYFSLNTFTIRR